MSGCKESVRVRGEVRVNRTYCSIKSGFVLVSVPSLRVGEERRVAEEWQAASRRALLRRIGRALALEEAEARRSLRWRKRE